MNSELETRWRGVGTWVSSVWLIATPITIGSLLYSWNLILLRPLAFVAYVLIIFIVCTSIDKKLNGVSFFQQHSESTLALSGLICGVAGLLFIVADGAEFDLPDFFETSFDTRSEASHSLNPLANGFLVTGALVMGSRRQLLPRLSAIAFAVCALLVSGTGSRGSLAILLAFAYCVFADKAWSKYVGGALLGGFIILSASIMSERVVEYGATATDALAILFREVAPSLDPLATVEARSDRWRLFLFFLPSMIKGSWEASNYSLSEHLTGLSPGDPMYFVVTIGDFAVHSYAYGNLWPVSAAFGAAFAAIVSRIFCIVYARFAAYFFVIAFLIGGRVTTESFAPMLLSTYLIPFVACTVLAIGVSRVRAR